MGTKATYEQVMAQLQADYTPEQCEAAIERDRQRAVRTRCCGRTARYSHAIGGLRCAGGCGALFRANGQRVR